MDWAAVQMSPAFGFSVVGLVIVFGPLIAERLRLPGLLGLLAFGAIIGPNMLDVLPRFIGLQAVGSIGVLYLIFRSRCGSPGPSVPRCGSRRPGVPFATEAVSELTAMQVLKRGICVAYTLNNPCVIRLEPPLIISEGEVRKAVETLDASLSESTRLLAMPA